MDFAAEDCLFIAVDVQHSYAGAGGHPLPAIYSLWSEIGAAKLPAWQVLMRNEVHPSRQAMVDHRARPALSFNAWHHTFWKKNEAPEAGSDFAVALLAAKPQALFLFGYYEESCVTKTARLAHALLADAGIDCTVHIIDDCSKVLFRNSTSRDRQRRLGPQIRLIERDEMSLKTTGVTVANELRASRPQQLPLRPNSDDLSPAQGLHR